MNGKNVAHDNPTRKAFGEKIPIGVEHYPEGCRIHSGIRMHGGNPTGKGGGLRGKVRTFSLASRRRFRLWMLTHAAPDTWRTLAASFTLPDPAPSIDECRDIWEHWLHTARQAGWGVIWRAEIQPDRQVLHWHCLVSIPPHEQGRRITGREEAMIRQSWWDQLDRHNPCVQYPRPRKIAPGAIACAGPWSLWPGAKEHSCKIESAEEGRGGWFRYLADHASKVKQEQVGRDIGRHWGIINRRSYLQERGELIPMTLQQVARFRRTYERLATPHVPDPDAPFGSRKGYRCKRGRHGSATCFVRSETAKRLAEWAMRTDPGSSRTPPEAPGGRDPDRPPGAAGGNQGEP